MKRLLPALCALLLPTALLASTAPLLRPEAPADPAPLSGSSAQVLAGLFGPARAAEAEPLTVDQAFQAEARMDGPETLVARWTIAPHHYLYREKFKVTLTGGLGVKLGQPVIPPGEEKEDEFLGKVRVFHDQVEIRVPVQRTGAGSDIEVEFGYQGCAEAGICYPPTKKKFSLKLPPVGPAAAAATTTAPPAAAEAAAPPETLPASEQDRLARFLLEKPLWLSIALFFALGIGLTFTPCVLPMIPILSGIIVGQGTTLTTRKAFSLSLTYVVAMALTYAAAGVLVALLGANLQAAFQNPWILSAFALVFVLLAFSMFGFYELQMPAAVQSRLAELSNRQGGGTYIGVGIMGLLSALIVGPCVTAPLVAVLMVIGQTGDPVLGFGTLFAMGMGMGVPLLVIGTSAGRFLPHAGGWMVVVKAVFGVLLLAVAVWMLERVVPPAVTMFLWALLLIVPGVFMGATEPLGDKPSGWRRLWKGLGLVLVLLGALLLVGLATGSRDPLAPLSHLSTGATKGGQAAPLPFTRIKSEADLERELASAKAAGKPVMLDFYAEWCVSCKEFEKYTFSDPGVRQALAGAVTLQADVTQNDDVDKALLRRFRLIGPPAILFFDANGNERAQFRTVGFQEPAEFRIRVEQALSR